MFRSSLLLVIFCVGSFTVALGVRRAVLSQQTVTLDTEAPFLMESALQFRMTDMVRENGTLPAVDTKVQVPEGVVMRETYSVGAEWVYTSLANGLPTSWTFTSRVRWVSTALFCLAIPFAGLWARSITGSMVSAWITAGILAASPAFAVRSSGLELSRENLAFPLFTLFLWMMSEAGNTQIPWRKFSVSLIGAVAVALAQCVWDLSQMISGLWIVWCWVRVFRDPDTSRNDVIPVVCVAVCLTLAAALNPYLRAHGFIFSPVMAMVWSRALLALKQVTGLSRAKKAAVLVGGILAFWAVGQLFIQNYSHFGDLLYAKLRYLNVKPADPSVLSFYQRIMWTPALNSTTWELTKAYFLFTLVTYIITLVVVVWGKRRAGRSIGIVLFSSLFTFPVMILFFRFHVFWVLFAAVFIGCGLALTLQHLTACRRTLLGTLLFLGLTGGETYLLLFFEPSSSSDLPPDTAQFYDLVKSLGGDFSKVKGNRWGRPGASYDELEDLSEQLRGLSYAGPVLANFGISASILAETGLPILLHPKFETPGIRERVRQFYEHLFLGSEQDLREWALKFGARYYVHSNGNLSDLNIPNSPRYMVDAVEPPAHAPVYVFEQRPQDAVLFQPIGGNRRYRIFRIITTEDEEFAESLTGMARLALESGDIKTAQRRARQALSYHWKYKPAQEILATVLSL